MSRRPLAAVTLMAVLLLPAGCLQLDCPVLPRLRSLLPGSNGTCAPGTVCDLEGPVLEVGEPVGPVPVTSQAPLPDGMMPQPRLVPQPSPAPEAQPTPYAPTKAKKG
jgi:hypothetical protein